MAVHTSKVIYIDDTEDLTISPFKASFKQMQVIDIKLIENPIIKNRIIEITPKQPARIDVTFP